MQHGGGFAGGAGDGGGSGVGLESFSIGEAGPVVAGLGEYPGAGERAEPWEAGDDPGVVPINGLSVTDGAETDRIQGGYDFFLKNDYTGAKWSAFVSFSPYDGSRAEMITEDPYGGVAGGFRLEEFDPFTVVDAEATRDGTTYRGIANFDHDDMIMRYKTDTLTHAGSANSGGNSWTDNWDNCK